jgi:hypothetical protein
MEDLACRPGLKAGTCTQVLASAQILALAEIPAFVSIRAF